MWTPIHLGSHCTIIWDRRAPIASDDRSRSDHGQRIMLRWPPLKRETHLKPHETCFQSLRSFLFVSSSKSSISHHEPAKSTISKILDLPTYEVLCMQAIVFIKQSSYREQLATTWLPLGYHLATSGYHLATTWLPLGYHLATTWLPLGYHLATTWRPLLKFLRKLRFVIF